MERRKIIISLLLVLSLLISYSFTNSYAENENNYTNVLIDGQEHSLRKIPIIINGQAVNLASPAFLYKQNTMASINFVEKELNAQVKWNKKDNTIIMKSEDAEIVFIIDSHDVYINGKKSRIPSNIVPLKLADDFRIVAPLKYVSEVLGHKVEADRDIVAVHITTKNGENKEKNNQVGINKANEIKMEKINGKDAIVIYNSKTPSTNIMKLKNPNRIVVDILNSTISNGQEAVYDYNLGVIKRVRTSQFNPSSLYNLDDKVVRVVLDVKEGVSDPKVDIINEGNKIIIYPSTYSEKKPETPPSSYPINHTIFLDAGHGGKDPGALGNGIKEKDIALAVALNTGEILKKHNIDVKYSRTTDIYVSLSDRANMANNSNADAFLAFHCNSFNGNFKGIETYSYPGSAKGAVLAKCIHDSVIENGVYTTNRGTRTANFAVLRETKMPATLIEMGFIDNPQDDKILKNKQDDLAEAIAEGILKFLDSN